MIVLKPFSCLIHSSRAFLKIVKIMLKEKKSFGQSCKIIIWGITKMHLLIFHLSSDANNLSAWINAHQLYIVQMFHLFLFPIFSGIQRCETIAIILYSSFFPIYLHHLLICRIVWINFELYYHSQELQMWKFSHLYGTSTENTKETVLTCTTQT